ncbi:hypothetical protein ABZ714_24125 [Streptomyces sp. NPDC006798]|uniref:hypothetical protein n=1 Tax=Streptomyces sp. NPDC006798 TaxID=3155462 RepID=UPI0033F93627
MRRLTIALTTLALLAAGTTTAQALAGAPQRANPHNQIIGEEQTVIADHSLTVTVECPAGSVPTGGGAFTGGAAANDIFFTSMFPSGEFFSVSARNTNPTQDGTITPMVICTVP